jgi:hypothetical protein
LGSSLVWTGSEYGVSWFDERDGNYEIYFARLDALGNKIGSDVRVTNDPLESSGPSLVWTGSEYGVSWHDFRDGNYEIYFARLRCCDDVDGDGYTECAGDCSDQDIATYPGAPERCDGRDNNCDGIVPPDEIDNDCDGYVECSPWIGPVPGPPCAAPLEPRGLPRVIGGGDCNDDYGATYPDAPETNDAQDNQCPGEMGYGIVDEVSGLMTFEPDKATFCWPGQAGADLYEIARSEQPDFSACRSGILSAVCAGDPEVPATGQAFYYLVRAASPNPGSWGQDSAGNERIVACSNPVSAAVRVFDLLTAASQAP